MAKSLGRPAAAASRRRRRAQSEWKVESQGVAGGTPALRRRSATRVRISSAALLVNVTARMDSAGVPLAMRLAMRKVMARVLPVPAPARIKTGPSVVSAARRCSGLSWSRRFCILFSECWSRDVVVGIFFGWISLVDGGEGCKRGEVWFWNERWKSFRVWDWIRAEEGEEKDNAETQSTRRSDEGGKNGGRVPALPAMWADGSSGHGAQRAAPLHVRGEWASYVSYW